MPKPKQHHKSLPPRLRWQHGAYYYVSTVNGQRIWERLGTDYAQALEAWTERERGHPIESRTVAAALDRYLQASAARLAPRTLAEYARQATRIKATFQGFNVDEIEPRHIGQYLDAHPHKTAANREMALLSVAINHVRRLGWCRDNPVQGIKRNRETKRTRYLTDAELGALVAAAHDPQMAALIEIAYLTAARISDLLKIRLSDITPGELHIQQGKTGQRQGYLITPALQAASDQARSGRTVASLYLFANRSTGQPYTLDGFESNWARLVKRSGVRDCHFHDLRAKSLTDAHRAKGRDYAQLLAGHASGEMTERYIKLRQTAEIKPLK